MEQFFIKFAHAAAWGLGVMLILAVIGVIAIIQWIANAVRGTERAVSSGVHGIEGRFHHGDDGGEPRP